MKIEERVESMLGHLSVGDALGKICSKYTKQEIINIYGKPITELVKPIRRRSIRDWYRGAITDDTILTLLVADSLIECEGFDRRDIARRLIKCDPKGGNQINLLKMRNDLDYVADSGVTNGAAIRVSPLVVVYSSLEELTENVVSLSTLTHGTDEAITGALLVAYTLNYCLEERKFEAEQFIIKNVEKRYPDSTRTQTLSKLKEGFAIARTIRDDRIWDRLEQPIGYLKYSWSSIPTAIVLGVTNGRNYECLIDIIHRNVPMGDLDTVASIAGSILGLRRKDARIEQMAEEIEKANRIDFYSYANRLLNLRTSKND